MTTMRGLVVKREGEVTQEGVLVLEDKLERPIAQQLKGDELLVEVKAASLNPVDFKMAEGWLKHMGFRLKTPCVAGLDFSGVIKACGPACRRLRVDDVVFGKLPPGRGRGSLCEVVVTRESEVVTRAPGNVGSFEAAALPLASITAMHMVQAGKLFRCDDPLHDATVLILGGSGGVGSMLVQICKSLTSVSKVIATCGQRNLVFVRQLGADQAVDYATVGGWAKDISPGSVDVVLDAVGDSRSYDDVKPLLRSLTRSLFVTVAQGAAAKLSWPAFVRQSWRSTWRRMRAMPPYIFVRTGDSEANLAALEIVKIMVEDGKLRPYLDAVFPLAKSREAFAKLRSGHARGKVVVQVSN